MKFNLLLCCKSVLLAVAVVIVSVQSWTDFQLIGIENTNTGCFQTNFRITRYNRTVTTIHGNFTVVGSFQDYDCESRISYSSAGNNQYKLSPFKVARDTCCNFFESIYWKVVEPSFLDASPDIPRRVADELYCETFKEGAYSWRNLVFNAKKSVLKISQPGNYRCDFNFYRRHDNEKSTLEIFGRLT